MYLGTSNAVSFVATYSSAHLLFTLRRTCALQMNHNDCTHTNTEIKRFNSIWVSNEVKYALKFCFKVITHFEFRKYKITYYEKDNTEKINGLFVEYIIRFLKIKRNASGWPVTCTTENDINKYNNAENIKLDDYVY